MKTTLFLTALFCASLSILPAQTPELFLQTGHNNAINAVAYSPDGRRIATGSGDNTIKIWDAESGREIRTLAGHTSTVYAVSYSPDGRRIVSGSYDNTLKIWNAETGQEIRTLTGHPNSVHTVDYSPDGRRIVSGSSDNTVKIWNAETGQEIRTLAGHTSRINSVTYSPDGRQIASGSYDKAIRIWDAENGREIRTIAGHNGRISSAAFSPDGRRVVSTAGDHTLKIWDVETGRELRTITAGDFIYLSTKFSPDGKQILCGSNDKTVKVFDAETGKELRSLAGHSESVLTAAYSPDGRRILSGSWDWTAKVWDAATGRELLTLQGNAVGVFRLAFSPDSTRLVSSSLDGVVRIWDLRGGRMLRAVTPHRYNGTAVPSLSLAWSADGRRILSGGDDDTVKLLDAATGETLRSIPTGAGSALAVSYRPDGKSILAGLQDKALKLFDAETGREIRAFTGHTDSVGAAIFSSDGRRIYSGSDDKSIKVWNAATGQLIRTIHDNPHSGRVNALAVGSGKEKEYLISGGVNGYIIWWDPEKTGNEAAVLARNYNSPALSVVIQPGAISSISGLPISLPGLMNGKIVMAVTWLPTEEFPGHAGPVNQLAYSPDGRWLASASSDGTLRLSNAQTRKEAVRFIGFSGGEWVCLSPDGWYNASAKGDQFLNARNGNTVSGLDRYRSTKYLPNVVSNILTIGLEPLVPLSRLSTTEGANAKTIDSDWGAAVHKELTAARFLGDSAVMSRWEAVLQTITGRGNASRADIEAYYRQNIGAAIAAEVDAQFNKVSFTIETDTDGANTVLTRRPNQFILDCDGYWGNPKVEETRQFTSSSLEDLIQKMQASKAFRAESYNTVRSQVALIPAVRLNSGVLDDIKRIVTAFYTNPTAGTYNAVKEVYALYTNARLTIGEAIFEKTRLGYVAALTILNASLARKVIADAEKQGTYTALTREQQQRFITLR